MREKIPAVFTFILLLTAVLVVPVQAESTDIILGSFDPNENYESYMEFFSFFRRRRIYLRYHRRPVQSDHNRLHGK